MCTVNANIAKDGNICKMCSTMFISFVREMEQQKVVKQFVKHS